MKSEKIANWKNKDESQLVHAQDLGQIYLMIKNLSRSFMTILSTSSTTTGRLVFVLKHHSLLMIRFGDFNKVFLRINWQWLNNVHDLIPLWLHHYLCPFSNVYRINGNKQ